LPGNRYRLKTGPALEKCSYWDFSFDSDFHTDKADGLVDRFNSLFARVIDEAPVKGRDRVGNILSGAVDSSYIQAHLNRPFGDGLYSFSLGFPEEKKLDESDYAISAAELFGTSHHVFPMDRDAFVDNLASTICANRYPLQLYHAVPYAWLFRSVPS